MTNPAFLSNADKNRKIWKQIRVKNVKILIFFRQMNFSSLKIFLLLEDDSAKLIIFLPLWLLREINFGWFQRVKIASLITYFSCSEFEFLSASKLLEWQFLTFWNQATTLISRKIRVALLLIFHCYKLQCTDCSVLVWNSREFSHAFLEKTFVKVTVLLNTNKYKLLKSWFDVK